MRLVCLLLCLFALHAEARNVLLIIADDMRVDARAVTPNLDALAAQSRRYTQAYTTVPSCLGSRATLFSGVIPTEHGFTSTGIGSGAAHEAYFNDPNTPNLIARMKAAGYHTGSAGKTSHTELVGVWDETGAHIPYTEQYNPFDIGPDGTWIDAAPLDPSETHPDQLVASWAIDFIESQQGPWFLAVGFYRPHLPWRLPESYYSLYPSVTAHIPPADILDDEPPEAVALANAPAQLGIPQYDWITGAGKADDYTRYYLAGITHTDAMAGQVLDALANSQHAGDTDVIFLSDHGFNLGEHRHWRKAVFWQESVRVPLYIKSPQTPPGEVTSATSLLDIAPTILDLAGASPEPGFDGVSLLSGRSQVKIYYQDAVASLFWGIKLIDYTQATGNADRAAYFYLTDPGETTNVVNQLFP